jgi:hypothetical protein
MECTQPSVIGVASILVATRYKLDSRGARVEGRSHLRVDSGMCLRGARKNRRDLRIEVVDGVLLCLSYGKRRARLGLRHGSS